MSRTGIYVTPMKDDEKVLVDSSTDRNEANRLQLKHARMLVNLKETHRFSIGVHRIPGTGAWGIYLEPRNN